MDQKKKLTDAEREAIAAKYQRRILELGTAVFGPPDEVGTNPKDAKAQELERRIIDASIQLFEAAPPDVQETAPHRKPGDLNRTAERQRTGDDYLPDGFDRAKITFGHEMDAVTLEALAGLLPILEVVKNLALDIFHEVKRWAEEDPEGPAAGYYREMNRAWRQGAGRSRTRT